MSQPKNLSLAQILYRLAQFDLSDSALGSGLTRFQKTQIWRSLPYREQRELKLDLAIAVQEVLIGICSGEEDARPRYEFYSSDSDRVPPMFFIRQIGTSGGEYIARCPTQEQAQLVCDALNGKLPRNV